ncbi:DNA replication protein DnaD [Lentilactobacillus curieae]|uniref:DNA replication protein DnaD n=1 Tax=Lentilactobacillus curieae TaxID=1138822 RepID=A0A1S6QLC1_9LACO|nr:DNA replication protein DnaD [Lentilactobacillus curieae]
MKNIFQGSTSINNLLLQHYPQIGLSNDELLIYLLIKHDQELVIPMPNIQTLVSMTGFSKDKIFELFHRLIEHKNATITRVTGPNGQVDAYDFSPMYEKLLDLVQNQSTDDVQEKDTPASANVNIDRSEVFNNIEQEFGRTLSPIEMETISGWLDIDHYSSEIISLALREAVLNQVYNLKYMDRIMLNWDKLNLHSAAQIQAYTAKREGSSGGHNSDDDHYSGPEIPFINFK